MELNQSNFCLQFSCPERSVSVVYVCKYVCAAAVVLLTALGNLLVIISVCHFKQLHTPTNMLVLSLAVSDFLVGTLIVPIAFIWIIESCWVFNKLFCMSSTLTSYFLTSTSIYTVALIAVDRYFALSNPFLYTETVSVTTMCIVILCDWCIWLPYNIVLEYYNGSISELITCPGHCLFALNEVWSLIDLLLTFVFPCSVIIIFYGLVFVIAKKHATAIRDLNVHTRNQTSKNAKDSMKSERKGAKVLGIVVSGFLSCLFPYFFYSVLGDVVNVDPKSLQKVLYLLLYLNSTINPVIYALFYPWFRKSVKIILTLEIFKTDSAFMSVL